MKNSGRGYRIDFMTIYHMRAALVTLLLLMYSCSGKLPVCSEAGSEPTLSPDYAGITIPYNIAPLNFSIKEKGNRFIALFSIDNKTILSIRSNDNEIRIAPDKWRDLLSESKGKQFKIEILVKDEGKWHKYLPVFNKVAEEQIDSYLVYRLIEPGFEMWGSMGIYQRSLEGFKESPVMVNEMSDHNCINCHAFSGNGSQTMLFHMRGNNPGTIIYRNGAIKKVDTRTDQTISAGVYPSWHPDGRLVAFSVNKIMQSFHAISDRKIEVQDTLSDLIIYDSETDIVRTCEAIATKDRFETFPAWSPDGRHLYFCSAKALPSQSYDSIRYDLLRIDFNPATQEFGAVDTVISSSSTGLSVSFPRISPDGRYLLFCMSDYGNFSIWHKESDLYLVDLETRLLSKPGINSDQTESYHSWSSNGRWIVFSSRRGDGLFTKPYFSYFDQEGSFHKPFVLPQKSMASQETFLKSYNIPELVSEKVRLNPRIISKIVRVEPFNSRFEKE